MPLNQPTETASSGVGGLVSDSLPFPPDFASYETLSFDSYLSILGQGEVALFRRRQRVRFLENGVSVFIDRLWGEGVLLAGYSLSRGMGIIEALRTRKGYAMILSLPRRFKKGEVLTIETERRIVGGFANAKPYWELAMWAPTQRISLKVSMPSLLRMSDPEIVAPARGEMSFKKRGSDVTFAVGHPGVHVPYRLEWKWQRKSRARRSAPAN